ncbi:hypothetical protein LCGC14_1280940, partial [marine sediment metagenome]
FLEEIIAKINDRLSNYIEKVRQKALDPYSMANLIIKMLGLEK